MLSQIQNGFPGKFKLIVRHLYEPASLLIMRRIGLWIEPKRTLRRVNLVYML